MVVAALFRVSERILPVAIVSGVFAFAYFLPALPGSKKRLRDFGLLKIVVLTSVWTIATGVLPLVNAGVSPAAYPYELAQRFIFVFALCVLFDIRDIETDSRNNITTLPNRLGVVRAYRLVNYSLLAFLTLSIVQYARHPELPERLAAAVVTAVITFCVSGFVRRHPGHAAFVALTDGMMLLYAALSIVPHIVR
jgi:1,4-dihydroxy-2-naphthoate octaprenyltransferase